MSALYDALRKLEEGKPMSAEKSSASYEAENVDSPEEKIVALSPLFLVETLRDIRKTVTLIYKVALLAMEKSENADKERTRMVITKAYDQIISTLDTLSGYIHVTSPITKKDTIHCILEEILESNEEKLQARKIELKKMFAPEIPETTIHDEQLRFILDLAFQYTILSIPYGGKIEIATQFVDAPKEEALLNRSLLNNRYSEILISSSSSPYPFNEATEAPRIERNGTSHFILRLIREMVRRSQGSIDFQVEQIKSQLRMSIKLPVERRRLAYYRPANL